MEPTFRQSMSWLHTWAGVVVGALLFAIFWMGTLAVFDKEIDSWMIPAIRIENPAGAVSFDEQRSTYQDAVAVRAPTWNILLPSERVPVVRTGWFGPKGVVLRYNDPSNGKPLPDPGTAAASGFIYPFHYNLHLRFMNLGMWLVGFASMAMLALIVSGVVIHRKIFANFFVFRPERKTRRAVLDLHNIAGVIGLPFHFVITLSGVVVFFYLYFPSGWMTAYGSTGLRTFNQDLYGSFSRPRTNTPGSLASLDAMADQVRHLWPTSELASLTVYYPGDAAAYVQINTSTSDRVTNSSATAVFDGASGKLLFQRSELAPIMSVYRFLFGMHAIQFSHWTLRWLYFVLGIMGCVLIATGFVFWVETRRKSHRERGLRGVRIVEALATGSVTGIIVATFSFFVVNRILPTGIENRSSIEIWAFYLVWLLTFVHAASRPGLRGWRQQSWMIAVLAMAAVILNAVTTGDYLGRSFLHRSLWPVAGMDCMLLLAAAIAFISAQKLARVECKMKSAGLAEGRAANA